MVIANLILDKIKSGKKIYSFEIFPPKSEETEKKLMSQLEVLAKLKPDFISVTYGAMGNTRDQSLKIAKKIKNDFQIEVMMHLTCVNHDLQEIDSLLEKLKSERIFNLMVLRGDRPKNIEGSVKHSFDHASDFIAYIRNKHAQTFSIGAAAYPEGHQDSPLRTQDYFYAKLKQDQGADFLVTQLFFESAIFESYLKKIRSIGVSIPVLPGIMPVMNLAQVQRIVQMTGCSFPESLNQDLKNLEPNSQSLEKVAELHALGLCQALLNQGAVGIHFYTLNQAPMIERIVRALT